MTYALRSVLLRVCSAALFCAVAFSITNTFANTSFLDNGLTVYIEADGCPGTAINGNYTISGTMQWCNQYGQPQGPVPINESGHLSTAFPASGVIGFGSQSIYPVFEPVSGNITFTFQPAAGSTNQPMSWNESFSSAIPGYQPMAYWDAPNGAMRTQPHAYRPYPGACPQSGSYYGNSAASVTTDNSGTPWYNPQTGQILLPGQTVTNAVSFSDGQSGVTNTWIPMNNANGNYDGLPQQFYFTNSGGSNGVISSGGSFPSNPSANSDYLAYSNGGPIVWTPDMATNPNAVNEAGFNGLINALNNDQLANNLFGSNLLHALTNPPPTPVYNISNSSSSGYSNVWVMNWPSNFNGGGGTNILNGYSNVWVQNFPTNISTNAALAMVWANTNQAGTIVSGASAQVGNLSGMVPNTLADNAGAAEEQDIRITPPTAPQQVTIAMGVLPSSLSTTFSQIRGVIAWFVCILLAIWNFVSLFRTIKDVSQVPQAQGPDTGAWAAVGANIVTALVVASAVVAVISVLPVFAVGILAGELTFANSYSSSSPLNFFNSMGWGFQFLSQYLPIYLMFTAFGVRVVFYFGLEVLAFFACIMIKLLIGV